MIANVKKINNRNGFTLVELLISLSLLLIVLSGIYTFYFFERNTFKRGESQSIVQENVVRAAQFITDEIRNAVELSLDDFYTEAPGYCSIFIEGSTLKYDDGTGNITNKTDDVINEFSVDLVEAGGKYKIKFNIGGVYNSQDYDISTEIMLNNVKNASPSSGKSVIRYIKP